MLDWSRYREFTDPLPTRDIVTDSPEETVNALNSAILIALLEQSNEIPKNSTEPFEINSGILQKNRDAASCKAERNGLTSELISFRIFQVELYEK
ncbi:hypothetical protein TNCT_666271 [Trichonephila clavata]|uniref:Uncharacterized protein n=1 Tax=Trichonephila clavata TaxID=2740835 RepID=A0A8X6LMN6_TRICU|nr:hypothetical protein TNCT_666271 [Trichonephila clavata]